MLLVYPTPDRCAEIDNTGIVSFLPFWLCGLRLLLSLLAGIYRYISGGTARLACNLPVWRVVFHVRGWDDVIRLCRRDRTSAISSAVDVTKIVPLFAVNVVPLSYRGRLRHLMPCKEEATKWLRKVGQAQYFIPIALLSGGRKGDMWYKRRSLEFRRITVCGLRVFQPSGLSRLEAWLPGRTLVHSKRLAWDAMKTQRFFGCDTLFQTAPNKGRVNQTDEL